MRQGRRPRSARSYSTDPSPLPSITTNPSRVCGGATSKATDVLRVTPRSSASLPPECPLFVVAVRATQLDRPFHRRLQFFFGTSKITSGLCARRRNARLRDSVELRAVLRGVLPPPARIGWRL